MSAKPLDALLIDRNRRFSWFVFVVTGVLYGVLQWAVMYLEAGRSQGVIEKWLGRNYQRVEQALFLENTLDVRGLISDLRDQEEVGRSLDVLVFDLSGRLVAGTDESIVVPKVLRGFSKNLLTGRVSYYAPLVFSDRPQGRLFVSSRFDWIRVLLNSIGVFAVCGALYLLVQLALRDLVRAMQSAVVWPIAELSSWMSGAKCSIDTLERFSMPDNVAGELPAEVIELLSSYNSLVAKVKELSEQERAFVKDRVMAEMAAQVAHDIRSPLTALNVLMQDLPAVSQDKRMLLQGAIGRIHGIASNLLDRRRAILGSDSSRPLSVQLLASLVDAIVVEKKLQYRQGKRLVFEEAGVEYGVLAQVDAGVFRRILSNLIDNAVDAITAAGVICVSARVVGDRVEVAIRDNGKGIAKPDLDRILGGATSVGKPTGNGLGLAYSRKNVERWGGRLRIQSELGAGTEVVLELPAAAPPAWFVPDIKLSAESLAVIVDDDPSIHDLWRERFAVRGAREIPTENFLRLDQALARADEVSNQSQNRVWLVDYEFSSESLNGVSLLERLGSGSRGILVTNKFADPDFLVGQSNVKALPKNMISRIPISLPTVYN